ncbi:MAG: hypothetical protein ACTSP5_14715 [Candidatus Heimdallarchaeota archaeon]
MTEYFNFFYVKAVGNGSLFVGPKFKVIEDEKEQEDLLELAHRKLKDAVIDVSRILKDEDYGALRFYINDKLNHEIDEDY